MYFVVCFLIPLFFLCVFFFFKQKTAYEMRISDWSSDVCSSDLNFVNYNLSIENVVMGILFIELKNGFKVSFRSKGKIPVNKLAEIGRASCRERVCQYV